MWTVDAEAITQICAKREAFPKPLENYALLEIFGKNLVTTEGNTWKAHRKITSPSFNEKSNALVFGESANQAQQMLKHWTGPEGKGNFTLETVAADTMRTALHIISRVGFGVSLLWPGEEPENTDPAAGSFSSSELRNGHTMSFADALGTLLESILMVGFIPTWLLSKVSNFISRLKLTSTRTSAYESNKRSVRIFRRMAQVHERSLSTKSQRSKGG